MPLLLAGPRGADTHDGGPNHPEQPARIDAVMRGVVDLHLGDDLVDVAVTPASREDLSRVHTSSYLDEIERFCLAGGGDLDEDTFARPDSYAAALEAAGAGLSAVRALRDRGDGVGFVAVRPPGHHAGASTAMGFCLLNNIAVAAAALSAAGDKVCIVDWDVHHGNGTQDLFYDDPSVLFVSLHQWPLYPGTGAPSEVGGPSAVGLTVNVPLPPGATGDVARRALEEIASPAVERFGPDWVLVSCGFDAHRDDPLGGLGLSSGDFADAARVVGSFAPRPGRLALFLEGGYSAAALRTSTAATLGALLGAPDAAEPATSGGPGNDAVARTMATRDAAIDAASS